MSTMTPQDIAQLSGRDLDAAMLQYIMKLEAVDFMETDHMPFPNAWMGHLGNYHIRGDDGKSSLYNPSEDDALALQAADKVGLFEKGYFLYAALDSANVLLWCVISLGALADSVLGLSDDIANLATGATRAEAVCRASLLLAMEGK